MVAVSKMVATPGENFKFTRWDTPLLKERVFLNFLTEEERQNNSFSTASKSDSLQYDGASQVVNEKGFASRNMVISTLEKSGRLKKEYLPDYTGKDLLDSITYGELGYLLSYALEGVEIPKLGRYKPEDSRLKLSIIQVEGVQTKTPEYRLSQYSSSRLFSDYLEDIRLSLRPVPVPLFYGYMEQFGRSSGVSLLGQVSREEVFQIFDRFGLV